uniref:Uncharacterized protein n=1 Tax=Eubacterium cellulosolvens (strain ATCC 43171 / JCM 9499 / 6) TaxID=633697 RepID=I5AXK5_EUBC6
MRSGKYKEIEKGARANSMRTIMKKYENITTAYKFINGNIGVSEDGVVTLPLYMATFI